MNCHCHTHPKFNSSPLKNDTWKMKLPFGALPIFRCYKYLNFRDRNSLIINWYLYNYRFSKKKMLGYIGYLLAIHLVTTPPFPPPRNAPIRSPPARPAWRWARATALHGWFPWDPRPWPRAFPKDQRLDPPNWKGEVWTCSSYSRGVFGLLKMTVSFEGGQDT